MSKPSTPIAFEDDADLDASRKDLEDQMALLEVKKAELKERARQKKEEKRLAEEARIAAEVEKEKERARKEEAERIRKEEEEKEREEEERKRREEVKKDVSIGIFDVFSTNYKKIGKTETGSGGEGSSGGERFDESSRRRRGNGEGVGDGEWEWV
jgi:hypothetical protein